MSAGRSRAPRGRRQAGSPEKSKLRRKIAQGETERVAVWLTRPLATRLRVHAATQRMAISVAVEEAVRDYLRNKER